jgi:hypothetical protein
MTYLLQNNFLAIRKIFHIFNVRYSSPLASKRKLLHVASFTHMAILAGREHARILYFSSVF